MAFIRVNKKKARNLYNKGLTLYIVPNKVYPNFKALWVTPYELNKKHVDGYGTLTTFDNMINDFEYYNCYYELGYYTAYYIVKGG